MLQPPCQEGGKQDQELLSQLSSSTVTGGSVCDNHFWWPACRQDGRAAGSSPQRCTQVDFQCSCSLDPRPDIAVHFNPRFHTTRPHVICNTLHGGYWQMETRWPGLALQRGASFLLLFLFGNEEVKVSVNGQHFLHYRYRLPLSRVDTLGIFGDISVQAVGFLNISPFAEGSREYPTGHPFLLQSPELVSDPTGSLEVWSHLGSLRAGGAARMWASCGSNCPQPQFPFMCGCKQAEPLQAKVPASFSLSSIDAASTYLVLPRSCPAHVPFLRDSGLDRSS
ncbi:galectin-12 isoform X7 [Cavia porcellus]|uniref:galectin-12 isoform X7 n=1 Tax=Cavia porcellus TaxID=10141 RepID=UPI002FE29706